MASFILKPTSRWHHYFDNMQFSSQEYYQKLADNIILRKFPNTDVEWRVMSEGGLFSANRDYIRVQRWSATFDICAAPFGTGFFISWWFGEDRGLLYQIISKIPFIGRLLLNLAEPTTYFTLDMANIFKDAVHSCVLQTIEDMTQGKGMRALSDFERQPQSGSR